MNQREWMVKTLEQMWETTGGVNNWQPGIALAGAAEFSLRAVTIQFPIAIASFIETVENVEAAASVDGTTILDGKVLELKPDCYNVKEAMLADGLGTMFGALCGAVMPTTVYIGHIRHKKCDARGCTAPQWRRLLHPDDVGPDGRRLLRDRLRVDRRDPHRRGLHLPAGDGAVGVAPLPGAPHRHHVRHRRHGVLRPLQRRRRGDALLGMRGVANMAPGSGILCSMFVTAILCDLTDSRFFRAAIWCAIASLFSSSA